MRINVRADSITVGCLGWNSIISHRVPPPHLLWKASWILQKKIQSRPEHTRYQSLGHLWKVKVLSQAQGCSPGLFMWQGLFLQGPISGTQWSPDGWRLAALENLGACMWNFLLRPPWGFLCSTWAVHFQVSPPEQRTSLLIQPLACATWAERLLPPGYQQNKYNLNRLLHPHTSFADFCSCPLPRPFPCYIGHHLYAFAI